MIIAVTPATAGWTYVGFDLHRLNPGDSVAAETGDREVCLVLVTGKGATQGKEIDTASNTGQYL